MNARQERRAPRMTSCTPSVASQYPSLRTFRLAVRADPDRASLISSLTWASLRLSHVTVSCETAVSRGGPKTSGEKFALNANGDPTWLSAAVGEADAGAAVGDAGALHRDRVGVEQRLDHRDVEELTLAGDRAAVERGRDRAEGHDARAHVADR